VFAFDSEDGLKTIVAKATAGDAIWFLATINQIADMLAARGDSSPVGVRRARVVGILAQPAAALRLLLEHQHDPAEPKKRSEPNETEESDESDASDESAASGESADSVTDDVMPEPKTEPEPAPEADDHQSLSLAVPAGFTAQAARPRVVLHFHLSEAALGTGRALVRPDDGGPLTSDFARGCPRLAGPGRCRRDVRSIRSPGPSDTPPLEIRPPASG
jgi:hypothetical protein